MRHVETDFIVTKILTASGDDNKELTWPEPRWLIGWGPWIGVDKGNVFEGHLALDHVMADGTAVPIFMRGPHKERSLVSYDYAGQCEFFPAKRGRLIKPGDKLVIQLHVTDTSAFVVKGSMEEQEVALSKFAAQGSVRVFSVKA